MLLGIVARAPDAVTGIAFLVIVPLTFVANAFVATATLPGVLRTVAEYNPVSAMVAVVRTLFGNPTAPPADARGPLPHPVAASHRVVRGAIRARGAAGDRWTPAADGGLAGVVGQPARRPAGGCAVVEALREQRQQVRVEGGRLRAGQGRHARGAMGEIEERMPDPVVVDREGPGQRRHCLVSQLASF